MSAFANAPVSNPDGTTGIDLRVDLSNGIPHQNALNINGLCFNGGAGIGSFDAVKADPANFGPQSPRRFAYRYSLWTHQQVSTSTSSGCGELPGNDFQVALGGWNTGGAADVDGDGLADNDVGTVQQQAGTFIHEMGHTLNLGHGGSDGTNYKPNYLSLMSYFFQVSGIPGTDPDGAAGPLGGVLTLSRGLLAAISETALNETISIGAGAGANSAYFCPNGTTRAAAGTGNIDWNCNSVNTDTGVTNDVNGDRACVDAGANGTLQTSTSGDDVIVGAVINDGPDRTCNTAKTGDDRQLRAVGNAELVSLTDFDDWNNLLFSFQQTGAFEDGAHDSRLEVVEMDYPLYVAEVLADLALEHAASAISVVTGGTVTYTLTVRNLRTDQAREVLVEEQLGAGLSFVACSAPGGVCGGSGAHRTLAWPALAGGERVSGTISASLSCSLPDGAVLSSDAVVSSVQADPNALDNSASVLIVARNPAPVLSAATPSKTTLWPPNHTMTNVTVAYTVTDNCPGTTCSLVVSSSEPQNGTGDGDTGPDWQIVDGHHVKLRAERAGAGPGRTYTIGVICGDSGGAVSSTTALVRVPHAQ